MGFLAGAGFAFPLGVHKELVRQLNLTFGFEHGISDTLGARKHMSVQCIDCC